MHMKKFFLTMVMTLTATAVMAQENQFAVDAQLRVRSEYNNGAVTPRNEHELPANFTSSRARLGVDWQRGNLELKASVQHNGVWGADNMNKTTEQVTLNEAWGKFTFGKSDDRHFVKVGRQRLAYDDERILGASDWHQAGTWHDAILYGWETNYGSMSDKVHIALAYNQNRANQRGDLYLPNPMPYKSMVMGWYHIDFDTTPLGASFLVMNVGREAATAGNSDEKRMQLLGTDISFKPANLDIHGAFYYEMGKNVADQKVAAWMASGTVGYNITDKWKVAVGYDYLSGDDGTSDKQKTFDPLFGTHHKFLGTMDYYSAIPTEGISDIQASVQTKAVKRLDMKLNYHYLMLNNKRANLDKGLGHELDFQAAMKICQDVTLSAGYSFMLGTETMEAVKGTGAHKSWQDWGWVTLNISPRIFSTKW